MSKGFTPAGDLTVRAARAADAVEVHRLLVAMATELGAAAALRASAADLRRHGFGAGALFQALLAERAGATAGLAIYFSSFSTWEGCPGLYLQDLYVCPGERGHGTGRVLIAAVAARALAEGARYLRLSVDPGNRAACAFYSRAGLSRAEGERIYQARGGALEALAATAPR